MKLALPENAKIAKEAKECMQECVSEFISFITSEASEKCQQEKRKTVNGEDILFAMTSLGFENYAEALKIYLSKYREVRPVQRLWTTLSHPRVVFVPALELLTTSRPNPQEGSIRIDRQVADTPEADPLVGLALVLLLGVQRERFPMQLIARATS